MRAVVSPFETSFSILRPNIDSVAENEEVECVSTWQTWYEESTFTGLDTLEPFVFKHVQLRGRGWGVLWQPMGMVGV